MKKVFFCLIGAAVVLPAQMAPTYTWEERVQDYLHRTYGWHKLTTSAASTAMEHLISKPRQWDGSPSSFGYHLGGDIVKRTVRNTIELGAGALLHEDTRFQPSGETSFGARVRYAVLQSFRTSGDNHRFAFSRLMGTAGGALVSEPIYDHSITGPQLLQDIGKGYLGHIEKSMLTEFGPDLRVWGGRLKHKLLH